jgi:hypothetical protein
VLLVHALALLGDSYMSPSLIDLSVPLASSYRTFWTTMGIVAGWGLIVLGLTYYVRGRIGPARWRRLHRFTALLVVRLAPRQSEPASATRTERRSMPVSARATASAPTAITRPPRSSST